MISEELAQIAESEKQQKKEEEEEDDTTVDYIGAVSSTEDAQAREIILTKVSSSSTTAGTRPVNDISNLVRKKRPTITTNGAEHGNEAVAAKRKRSLDGDFEFDLPVKKSHSIVEAADSTTHT